MGFIMLVVVAVIGGWIIFSGYRLVAHRQHPRGIAAKGLAGAGTLGVLGIVGVPHPVWFLWWVLIGGFATCVIVAAVRAARVPLADHEMKPPGVTNLIGDAVVTAAVIAVAFLAG